MFREFNFNIIYAVLIMLFCILLSSSAVYAGTFNDVQNLIDSTNNGGTVDLSAITYYGSGNQININNKNNIVIQGPSATNKATLDADYLSIIFHVADTSSVITFRNINFINGNASEVTGGGIRSQGQIIVEDCTFSDMVGQSGTAIYLTAGAAGSTINNSQFFDCYSIYENIANGWGWGEGGAIDSHADNTLIENCLFENNYAIKNGGAISLAVSTGHTIINCVFNNNYADDETGGAILLRQATATITDCKFNTNSAQKGGAISITDTSTATITDCTFNGNSANSGGAIAITDTSTATISDCGFDGNLAEEGGTISITESSEATITDSSFNNSYAHNGGGAILIRSSESTISDSEFNDNYAEHGNGGSILIENSIATITNTEFNYNTAIYGSAIYNDPTSTLTINICLFTDNLATTLDIITPDNITVNRSNNLIIEISLVLGDNVLDAIYNEGNLTIDGLVPDEMNSSPNQIIDLTIDGITYTETTNSSGVATFVIPTVGWNIGEYTYTVEYTASALYTSYNTASTVNITQGPIQTPTTNPGPNPNIHGSNVNPGLTPGHPGFPIVSPNDPNVCDLKVNLIINPNPVQRGCTVTYNIYIENLGPNDAHNVVITIKFPKVESLAYSFTGTEWHKWTGSITIDKINKNQMIILYIVGTLP